MKERTKALGIPLKVKEAAAERDSAGSWPCCVICGTPAPTYNRLAFSNAHYIPRSQGGLGVEENIVTLCPKCHRMYDQSAHRGIYRAMIQAHLKSKYPLWDESKLTYQKEK